MGRKKLLYIMGIDWQWIYQRPQILAEKLCADYDVTVMFPRSILKRDSATVCSAMQIHILRTFPYQEKNALIGRISNLFNQKNFNDMNTYNYVYIGYPQYFRYIPENYTGKVIYDCMDNHEKLYPDKKRVQNVMELEQKLVRRSDLVIASAHALAEKMDQIAGCKKSVLIRNGATLKHIYPIKTPEKREIYHIGYIGTISEWFDYSTIICSLRSNEQILYHLIGPTNEKVEVSGILYEGTVSHGQLGALIEPYDCLVMPFKVNDIVSFVDPVKLYEYVAFGKCIVSVYYPEIERFRDFVYFYHTSAEYQNLLRNLEEQGFPPKYTDAQRDMFLKNNTWDKRYEVLKEKIEEL